MKWGNFFGFGWYKDDDGEIKYRYNNGEFTARMDEFESGDRMSGIDQGTSGFDPFGNPFGQNKPF